MSISCMSTSYQNESYKEKIKRMVVKIHITSRNRQECVIVECSLSDPD